MKLADANEEYAWPVPSGAVEPAAVPHGEGVACEIVGLNGQRASGRLIRFAPAAQFVQVQLNQVRRPTALRFDHFRMLVLTEPLLIATDALFSVYEIVWTDGSSSTGKSLDRQETLFGFFLFMPSDDGGSVRRAFVPRENVRSVAWRVDSVDNGIVTSKAQLPLEALSAEVTTPEQLLARLAAQTRMPIVRIGQALRLLGMVTEDQLADALAQHEVNREVPLGETLVRMGVVTRADLQVALASKMGYPLVDLNVYPASVDALRKVPHDVARRLNVMPLMLHEGRLIVALDDPANRRSALEEVEFIAQTKVVGVIGKSRDLASVLFKAYDKIGATVSGKPVPGDPGQPIEFDLAGTTELLETLEKEGRAPSDDEAPIEQSDNSLVRMINRMILEAHEQGVSDIHVESYPGREKIRIRFRRDGRLRTYLELPPEYRSALIARIKIMCDLDISEKRKPQDGKINFAKFSPQHKIELRVATIPTNNGLEDVVMRILASAKPIALDVLGLSPSNLAQFKAAIERPYGMVLCVGPTGSGKTTTLHSALMHINTPERKIWTAEDPIEITQPGLRQVQVNARIGWTFAKALRAFVRADPDVIMVGEIRDEETAKTAIEASLTGHLVLSTLHTNSAPETVTRLLDMGMDPFNFADSLLAVLAQRLVRRLCGHCVTRRAATHEEVEELLVIYMHAFGPHDTPATRDSVRVGWLATHGRDGALSVYEPKGCKHCDDTGFKGRVGIHELMVISRTLRRLVQNGARAEELQETAMLEGMRTLRQDGIDKVLAGHTTVDEVRATSNM
jgi:type II secretory ATPase GspE/PulE/Tfp pilus assembly ATPase PilB-like protein